MQGFQFSYTTSASSVSAGYLNVNLTASPPLLTISNFDTYLNPVFPIATHFADSVSNGTLNIDLYTIFGTIGASFRLDLTSAASPATDVTSYTILASVVADYTLWTQDDIYIVPFRFNAPQAGVTGPTGSTGAAGAAGSVGPTGASLNFGIGAVNSVTGTQTFTSTAAQQVLLGNVVVPSTTADMTLNTNSVTCESTGVYEVIAKVNWTSTALDAGEYQLHVRLNGTNVQSISTGVTAGGTGPALQGQLMNVFVPVTSGTVIDAAVVAPTTTSVGLVRDGPLASWLSVCRIA